MNLGFGDFTTRQRHAAHGRADLATVFVDAYVRASGDAELRRLVRSSTRYRAYVRGKVLGLRLDEPGLTPQEAAHPADEAGAYFDLAWAYAAGLPPAKPCHRPSPSLQVGGVYNRIVRSNRTHRSFQSNRSHPRGSE